MFTERARTLGNKALYFMAMRTHRIRFVNAESALLSDEAGNFCGFAFFFFFWFWSLSVLDILLVLDKFCVPYHLYESFQRSILFIFLLASVFCLTLSFTQYYVIPKTEYVIRNTKYEIRNTIYEKRNTCIKERWRQI